ncbi:retrovirus-related pol polyprotein from transposon TNT 1-94 [Tanacetum coccineum]
MGTVRLGNDHFAATTCYGNYVYGNITVFHVDYVEGLGHNLFSVGQFYGQYGCFFTCFSSLQSHFNKVMVMARQTLTSKLSVYFLHTKDETPEIIKKFIAQVQLNYNAKVHKIRIGNGIEFKNATLKAHYEKLGIMQQFSNARMPQQNGVAEANSIACFTQIGQIIHMRYNKTPSELPRIAEKPNVDVTQAEVVQFEMLKFLQHQLFRSLEDWEVSLLQCMQRWLSSLAREKDCFMPKGIKQSPLEKDFQDSPYDEEDTRSSHEYLNDLEEEYQARALLAKSKRFLKKGTQRFSSAKATDQTECHKCDKNGHFASDCWSKTTVSIYQSPFQPKPLSSSQHKPELRPTKDFEAKYNKVKAKLVLLSSSSSASKAFMVKNKGLIIEAYKWDEEDVSSDDNEMVEVKVLMALAEENDAVSKEGARNGEWVKISMRKVHTILEMEDNDDRKVCLDYLCIDLNYVEEQRSNLLSKHRNLVHELNACKEQLLVLKQAKLDFLTMQHVNTEILKENKNLRTEQKELKAITETWLNSSNKVNQCISEQIPSQKKRILGVDQLIEDSSSSGLKDLVFVKSSAHDTKVSIPGVERPWFFEAEGFILPNHDTGRILPSESQRNTTDPSVDVTDSSVTDYDSTDESSVCSTPLPPLKKLDGAEPISRPKTIKSILRSKSTFKAEALKSVIINEPSSAPTKGNKSSSTSKVHSAPASKLKSEN